MVKEITAKFKLMRTVERQVPNSSKMRMGRFPRGQLNNDFMELKSATSMAIFRIIPPKTAKGMY